jgi:hypothetical protein
MDWASFWAIFSKHHLVTLSKTFLEVKSPAAFHKKLGRLKMLVIKRFGFLKLFTLHFENSMLKKPLLFVKAVFYIQR